MNPLRTAKRAIKTLWGRDLFLRPEVALDRIFLGEPHAGFDVHPRVLGPKSVIYSIGVGDNISFDLCAIGEFGAQIFAFDPTPRSIYWLQNRQLPSQFHFSPVGLGVRDERVTFFPPNNETHVSFSTIRNQGGQGVLCEVRTLATLASERGHRSIDVLKMDIEGAEYDVLPNVLDSGISIGQILIEFHHRNVPGGARKTREAIASLGRSGFLLFSVSESGEEFSFIHRSKIADHSAHKNA